MVSGELDLGIKDKDIDFGTEGVRMVLSSYPGQSDLNAFPKGVNLRTLDRVFGKEVLCVTWVYQVRELSPSLA